MPFRKREIRNQILGFQFGCVQGFAGLVFGEALSQITGPDFRSYGGHLP